MVLCTYSSISDWDKEELAALGGAKEGWMAKYDGDARADCILEKQATLQRRKKLIAKRTYT